MISTESENTLMTLAVERGVSVDEVVRDLVAAEHKMRKIAGRTVLSREKGVAELSDRVQDLVDRAVCPALRIRQALMAVAGLVPDASMDKTLAGTVAFIGNKRRANRVLESWSQVEAKTR
jgi:hypothetical protein